MRLSKVLSIIAIVSLLATSVALVAYNVGNMTATRATAAELADAQPPAASVEVSAVTMGPVQNALSYSGSVKTENEVKVLPKVSGRLIEMKVDIGDRVRKGDVIARIDSDQPTAQLLQAAAALYAAKAKMAQMEEGARTEQVAQAEAVLKNAQAKLDRMKAPLDQNQIDMAKAGEVSARAALQAAQAAYDKIAWFDGKGALPQSVALQQATTAYEAARASYQEQVAGAKPEDIRAQEALVQQAKAALDLARKPYRASDFELARANVLQAQAVVYGAQLQLKECAVVAPIDGVISDAPLGVGSMAGPTSPIVTMVTPAVEITVKVEEARISQVKAGQPVDLHVAAFPDEKFPGKVSRISPTADPADRTFQIKVEPDQQDGRLKGGMFAEVDLITEQHANALLVPRSSVVSEAGQSSVMVVSGGQVERRQVTLGLTKGDRVQILSGVVLGEQVVASGAKSLKSGDAVKVVGMQG